MEWLDWAFAQAVLVFTALLVGLIAGGELTLVAVLLLRGRVRILVRRSNDAESKADDAS